MREILKLKPPTYVRRKPRPISEIANFKASELLNCLWFYIRYALPGLLPTRVVKHFEKLSTATYTLCSESMTKSEVINACDTLIEFANDFENIYGPGAITMDIHLLRHYKQMILTCGPIWSYCLFGFENNIGHIKNYVRGTTDVLEQISKKYPASQIESECYEEPPSDGTQISQPVEIEVHSDYATVLSRFGIILNAADKFIVWRRLRYHGTTFSSTKAIATASCDYFIKLKNGRIGAVEFYFKDRRTKTSFAHLQRRL